MKNENGFTLVELMITLAVAVIFVALAVPAFHDFVQRNRISAQANELVTAINLARDIIYPIFNKREFTGKIGNHELVSLKIDDAITRLHPLIGIGNHVFERCAGDADSMRGDTGP